VFRGCDPEIGSEAGVREVLRHTQGEGAGDPIGSPVPFGSSGAYPRVLLAIYLPRTIGGIAASDPNPLKSERITLSVNVQTVRYLDRLVETGVCGTTELDSANRALQTLQDADRG